MERKTVQINAEVLGIFRLGHRNVEVVLDWHETGGAFYFVPDSKSVSRIRIGMAYDKWIGVLNVALHEATEVVYGEMELTFRKTGGHTDDSANRLFCFDHVQFSEATARVAWFMAELIPPLFAAFKKRTRTKR